MDKKNIIASLVVSFIFLFYTIIEYTGLLRYFKLHIFDTRGYTEAYPKLEKGDKDRVIVAFVCDEKINLKPFINSVLNQTVRVDDIALFCCNKKIIGWKKINMYLWLFLIFI